LAQVIEDFGSGPNLAIPNLLLATFQNFQQYEGGFSRIAVIRGWGHLLVSCQW
jgi:hypothetical protein